MYKAKLIPVLGTVLSYEIETKKEPVSHICYRIQNSLLLPSCLFDFIEDAKTLESKL